MAGSIGRCPPISSASSSPRFAHRIGAFPAAGQAVVKERVNAVALAPADDFRRDGDLFAEGVRNPEAQHQIQAALQRGLQTRDAELALGEKLGEWADR
jgi:hypothetical protein